MFKVIKKIISLLWKQKRTLMLICSLISLFFFLRFPWNTLLEKTIRDLQKKYPSNVQTDFDKVDIQLFPPGIEFKKLLVNYEKRTLNLDSFEISMLLSKWLAFKKAWHFKAVKESSSLSLMFWDEEKKIEENQEESSLKYYFVKGHSSYLDLKDISSLFSNTKMSGVIKTRFDYEGSTEQMEEMKADLNLTGENLHLSQTEFNTPLGPLSFPSVKWKEAEVVLRLKEGELIIDTFRLGSPSDKLIIQMKGSGSVFFSYGKARLNSYNIQLQIDVDKNFQMNLLDLMFAGYKEDKGRFFRYILRLTGEGNQVPNMEKLSEF